MQMTLLATTAILLSLLPTGQREHDMGKQRKTPVELWCGGDDAFTRGVCQASLKAFESAPDFELKDVNEPENLIVTIPENVGWKKIKNRTRVTYIVEFSTAGDRVLLTRKGWCWHEEYAKCADQIIKQAKVAGRKLPR